jgi:uncharacterized protein (DUF2267 family)
MQTAHTNARNAGARLECLLTLVTLLVSLAGNLSPADAAALEAVLPPIVRDSPGSTQGWEERTEAALRSFLRAKASATSSNDALRMPESAEPIKRAVRLVCERAIKK